jgi:hypothetical protein
MQKKEEFMDFQNRPSVDWIIARGIYAAHKIPMNVI